MKNTLKTPILSPFRACKPHIAPYTEEEHRRFAASYGGCPITFRETDGTERQAIRMPSGEIFIDYRSEISALIAELTAHHTEAQPLNYSLN